MSKQIQNAVESAITRAVPSTYASSPVVGQAKAALVPAIVEEADKIADGLRAIAQREGLSESLVENALIEVGLADAPEPVEPETLEAKVERLLSQQDEQAKQIAALISAAKAYAPSHFRSL